MSFSGHKLSPSCLAQLNVFPSVKARSKKVAEEKCQKYKNTPGYAGCVQHYSSLAQLDDADTLCPGNGHAVIPHRLQWLHKSVSNSGFEDGYGGQTQSEFVSIVNPKTPSQSAPISQKESSSGIPLSSVRNVVGISIASLLLLTVLKPKFNRKR